MNYFAHARHYLDDPHFAAGTAVPDWLSVVNRRVRATSKKAARLVDSQQPAHAAVARGIMQHHHDDGWFHQTRAFAELNLHFTKAIRDLLPPDDSFRPSFLGHILVELLLDANLIADEPARLDQYYATIDSVDPFVVAEVVTRITDQSIGMLGFFIPRFVAERFLYDYAEDAKLLYRLNNVMRRVKLPQLPDVLMEFFPDARAMVRERQAELLAGESDPNHTSQRGESR